MKLKLVIGLALSGLILAGCMRAAPNEEKVALKNSVEIVKLSKSEQSMLKQAVRQNLKDPDSARFGRYTAFSYIEKGAKQIAVCGYVNAKNSYGGYGGEKPYIASASLIIVAFGVVGPGKFYDVVCNDLYGIVP